MAKSAFWLWVALESAPNSNCATARPMPFAGVTVEAELVWLPEKTYCPCSPVPVRPLVR